MSNNEKSQKPEEPVKSVFVISPIGAAGTPESIKAQAVLEYIIRQALMQPKWDVIRADEEADSGSITHKVIERIATSDLIVADLTDHNPNVFYELAVAHGYDKPVVNLMTEGQRMPFDIVDQRAVFYDLTDPGSVHRAKIRLAKAADNALAPESRITNPLAGYKLFASTPNDAEGIPANGAKLEYALDTIMARLGRIENEMLGETAVGLRLSGIASGFATEHRGNDSAASVAQRRQRLNQLHALRNQFEHELMSLNSANEPSAEVKNDIQTLALALEGVNADLRAMKNSR